MTYLRVRELAEQRGLNITTLSRRAELAYTTTSALWHGTASQFSLKTLERVACALDVRVSDLFAGTPDPTVLHHAGSRESGPHLLTEGMMTDRAPRCDHGW
jgi:DNA-binding Xre family transcriptional regulator